MEAAERAAAESAAAAAAAHGAAAASAAGEAIEVSAVAIAGEVAGITLPGSSGGAPPRKKFKPACRKPNPDEKIILDTIERVRRSNLETDELVSGWSVRMVPLGVSAGVLAPLGLPLGGPSLSMLDVRWLLRMLLTSRAPGAPIRSSSASRSGLPEIVTKTLRVWRANSPGGFMLLYGSR